MYDEKEYQRQYRAKHREESRAYKKKHYLDNKEKISQDGKEAYAANPEKFKIKSKKYRDSHPEESKFRSKIYRESHKEEAQEYKKEWRLNNPDKIKAHDIKWRVRNMVDLYHRNDKKRGFVCDLTVEWVKENIASKTCVYCGDTEDIGCDRIDNSKGHTMDNVMPCCKMCNYTRHNHFSVEEMHVIGSTIKKIKSNRT